MCTACLLTAEAWLVVGWVVMHRTRTRGALAQKKRRTQASGERRRCVFQFAPSQIISFDLRTDITRRSNHPFDPMHRSISRLD